MYCVGLTGLIGAGKSTVGEVFIGLGVPLYDCDSRAKELMKSDLRAQIIALFGDQSYTDHGQLNRAYLAEKVFADSAQLKRLESVVHPAVEADLLRWIDQQRAAQYVVVESAILIGNTIERLVDHLVVVSADCEVIIARVMRRDGASREQVERRLAAQMPAQLIIDRADSIIYTSEQEPIIPKVVAVNEKLLTLSLQNQK